jgi:hypothetical protein
MGQHALLAELEDGSQAIYRVDADGKLSLILREGAVTELGKIAHLGTWYNTPERGSYSGVSLNDKGQVALPIQTVDGIETVVVLTPTVQAAGPQAETTRTRAQEQHGEPAAVGTNEQDVATASLMRLRQLAKALMLYAQDSDEQFPPLKDAATAKKALLAYVRGEAVFVHPRTGEPYQPNPALSRQHLATIAEPWKTAAFYEARPAADGTRGVVFSDGHASRVTEAEWPEIKRASSLRFRAR